MEARYTIRRLLLVALFATAMGFLEAAVVVYLRLQFAPGGSLFPLVSMPLNILAVEVAREAATIIMLVCIGWIAGNRFLMRFAYFAYAFAVWDLFYYVFLKMVLGWPESFLTNDVLFLIPIPWIAPVLAPILCSAALVAASIVVVLRDAGGRPLVIGPGQWIGIAAGGLLILASFLSDPGASLQQAAPGPFPWWLFGAGFCVSAVAFGRSIARSSTRAREDQISEM